MKQSLQFKFTQNLALTPQLQQAIRLLQLSSPELNQELETVLQENPLLERSDSNEESNDYPSQPKILGVDLQNNVDAEQASSNEIDVEDFGESLSQRWEENHSQDDENDFVFQEIDAPSLHDHLMSQLKLMPLSERDQTLCMLLVDDINEDGYLEQPLEERQPAQARRPVGLRLLLARRRDLRDDVRHPLHRGHDLPHRLPRVLHQLRARLHLLHRVPDQRLDLLSRTRAPLRQVPHLRGHHRKPAPLLPRPRRLHRRAQRQNVRLERNPVDHPEIGRAHV